MPADMKGAPEVEIPADAVPNGHFLKPCPPEVTEIYTKIWTDLLK
jgi:spermidine/putrescine transport system substrate-binding protein